MPDTRLLALLHLKRRLSVDAATLSASDDARMESALRAAQAEIEAATGRRYVPIQSTVSHWALPGQRVLPLRDDLLELVSVTDADGTVYLPEDVTCDAANLALNEPARFDGGAVRVSGLWAYHPAPSLAFRPSGDSLAAPATSSALTLTVLNAAGADTWGDMPRFTTGHLLRIESELVRVTGVESNTLVVRRGENGTTAASHAAGAGVEVFSPSFTAEALGLRLASWLYREPDAEHGREWPSGIASGIDRLRRLRV